MSERDTPDATWVCPSCARRNSEVYRTCHCGYDRDAVVSRKLFIATVAIVVAAMTALGGLYWMRQRSLNPVAQSAAAATARAPASPAPATAPAARTSPPVDPAAPSEPASDAAARVAAAFAASQAAGTAATPAAETPPPQTRQPPPAPPAPVESPREQAMRNFEQAASLLARRADAFDAQWRQFRSTCYTGRVTGTFDREWFALFDARALPGAVLPTCNLGDVQVPAEALRRQLVSLNDGARRAEVPLAARRDVLRRYRLEYPGWDR